MAYRMVFPVLCYECGSKESPVSEAECGTVNATTADTEECVVGACWVSICLYHSVLTHVFI